MHDKLPKYEEFIFEEEQNEDEIDFQSDTDDIVSSDESETYTHDSVFSDGPQTDEQIKTDEGIDNEDGIDVQQVEAEKQEEQWNLCE